MILQCAEQTLDLATPKIMGILNITPDSFSDGGVLLQEGKPLLDVIYQRAQIMISQGASILDIGGESTRPGAMQVSVTEELDRVMPVIEILRTLPVILSLDTSKPAVMREALDLGVGIINDVYALMAPGAVEIVAQSRAAVCLMHMQGTPENMQKAPGYIQVVQTVKEFLQQRVAVCESHGISKNRLIVDPGFGFGKTLTHNLNLLKELPSLLELGVPLLVGMSRKSMIGSMIAKSQKAPRLVGSLAAALMALERGAHIVRVHDVQETQELIEVFNAVQQS